MHLLRPLIIMNASYFGIGSPVLVDGQHGSNDRSYSGRFEDAHLHQFGHEFGCVVVVVNDINQQTGEIAFRWSSLIFDRDRQQMLSHRFPVRHETRNPLFEWIDQRGIQRQYNLPVEFLCQSDNAPDRIDFEFAQ